MSVILPRYFVSVEHKDHENKKKKLINEKKNHQNVVIVVPLVTK